MAAPLTKSVRAVELVVAGKEFKAESAPVDQMELPNGVVVDQGLLVFPRSDWKEGKKKKKKFYKCSMVTGNIEIKDKCRLLLQLGQLGSWGCWARSAEGPCSEHPRWMTARR